MTKIPTKSNPMRPFPVLRSCCCALLTTLLILPPPAQAAGPLTDIVRQGLSSNPQVNAGWEALQAVGSERDAARGGFLPRLDLNLRHGYQNYDPPGDSQNLRPSEASIALTQMLYDGFATSNEIKRLNHEQLAQLFEFFQIAENTALEIVTAYIDLIRYRELLGFAETNLEQHQTLFEQLQQRVLAGVGRGVDLEQATGRLALAQSNRMVEQNNLKDVASRFIRLVGALPPEQLSVPTDLAGNHLSADVQTILRQALQSSPGLHAARERVRAAERSVAAQKASFQPRLELRAQHSTGADRALLEGHSDESIVGLNLDYNLFRGNADQATLTQLRRRLLQARELLNKTCREVRQSTDIAFHDIRHLEEQLQHLKIHHDATANAREAYRNQFDIGQRTLLDLLDTQNEYFQSQRAQANAGYDLLLAQARTLAGMGRLLSALDVRSAESPLLDELAAAQVDIEGETLCTTVVHPESPFTGSDAVVMPLAAPPVAEAELAAETPVPPQPPLAPPTAPDEDRPVESGTVSDRVRVDFAPESSRLPKEVLWRIARLGDIFKRTPDAFVVLESPTSHPDGDERLRQARLAQVRERLMFHHRISPQRIDSIEAPEAAAGSWVEIRLQSGTPPASP